MLLEAHALDMGSEESEVGTKAKGLSLPLVPWAAGQKQPDHVPGTEAGRGGHLSKPVFLP